MTGQPGSHCRLYVRLAGGLSPATEKRRVADPPASRLSEGSAQAVALLLRIGVLVGLLLRQARRRSALTCRCPPACLPGIPQQPWLGSRTGAHRGLAMSLRLSAHGDGTHRRAAARAATDELPGVGEGEALDGARCYGASCYGSGMGIRSDCSVNGAGIFICRDGRAAR
jgi:hypothetical protein